MKTQKLMFGLVATVLAGSLMITGCKKATTETAQPDTEQATASDNSYSENTSNDLINIGSQASENGSLSTYKIAPDTYVGGVLMAPTATVIIGVKIYTVDFGPAPGAACADGRVRSGKIIYDFTATTGTATAYRHPGFSFNVTTQNYVVDSYTVNIISKTITNTTPLGFNPTTTNLKWNVSSNMSIIKPGGGGTISWTCSRTTTLLNTNDTAVYKNAGLVINWLKAKIKFDGTASGTSANNESFSAVGTGLVLDMLCSPYGTGPFTKHRHPFISGTLSFTPGTRPTRTIDFGTGACDNTASITIDGHVYTFVIP